MSLITAINLSKSFGAEDVFIALSFTVARKARMALVGPNGVGKTTLLRILLGDEEASGGKVQRAKNIRIGYLPQEAEFISHGTLWDECLSVFAGLQKQQSELAQLEALMSNPDQAGAAMEKYGPLQEDFERKGGYTYPARIKQVLTGLGFSSSDYYMPLNHLSGGQRTRAYLARLLLSDPDLLLLDEPTNHLDISAVEWLEGYLSQWDGTAVIVSHDRYFLDKVANGIYEMTVNGIETFRGNYSAYLQQRHARWERRKKVFEAEKEKLLKEAEYIKKYIAGQNVTQARGKLRRLSRIIQAIEQVGMDAILNKKWIEVSEDVTIATSDLSPDEAERRVRALRLPDHHLTPLNLQLRAEKRSGELVIRTHDVTIGFPGNPLFFAPDIELRRCECAALIGPNGAGKTSFLKTILGQLEPLQGEVILGAALHIGYFAQAHEGLNPDNNLIQEIQVTSPNMLPADVRNYLGRYLFSADDVFKKVDVLSGGERGRLALAKLALQDTNLLLLDEPTNHLDIISQEILQEVLDNYAGTILLVTHDRYLINALATQIWEINPDESQLTVFRGTYSQMCDEREKLAGLIAAQDDVVKQKRTGRSTRSLQLKEERRRIARAQELENKITILEAKLAQTGQLLENPPADPNEVRQLGRDYTSVQTEMDELLVEWEKLQGS